MRYQYSITIVRFITWKILDIFFVTCTLHCSLCIRYRSNGESNDVLVGKHKTLLSLLTQTFLLVDVICFQIISDHILSGEQAGEV